MRTTLTLEADVWQEVERLRRERNTTSKETINSILRAGIAAIAKDSAQRRGGEPFQTEPASLGTPRLASLDNIDEVLSLGEGEDYR